MAEKVVVVEDNPDVRGNLQEILQSADYDVEVAENGKIGIEVIKRTQPDLVLCDVMMPEMDGYDVLKLMRNNPSVASTPFVFLTAKTAKKDLSHGMEMGADDYIMKPFTIAELLKRVKTRLNKRKDIVKRSEEKLSDITNSIGMPITHELNAPLKTIVGIGELITTEHYNMEKSEIVEFASLIHKAGLELKDLVGRTMNFYEIEELKHNPDKVKELKSSVSTEIKEVVESVANKEAKEIFRENDLVMSVADGKVAMPEYYVKQILSNLINNAFKFSVKGSMVRVVGGVDNLHAVIKISDEGIGMTDEDISKIGAYRKFDDGESKKGLGLGLTNAKRLVEVFDGSFTINSNKGVGTLVQIKLPLRK
jgi:CheY-like chemotaxis protein/two-component sensor histidine kinase